VSLPNCLPKRTEKQVFLKLFTKTTFKVHAVVFVTSEPEAKQSFSHLPTDYFGLRWQTEVMTLVFSLQHYVMHYSVRSR
jgi:hypothetical protein